MIGFAGLYATVPDGPLSFINKTPFPADSSTKDPKYKVHILFLDFRTKVQAFKLTAGRSVQMAACFLHSLLLISPALSFRVGVRAVP